MLTRRLVGRLGAAQRAQGHPARLLQRTLASQAPAPSPNDAFANGTNAYYADEMYRLWKQDPQSVHPSWRVYFSGMDKGLTSSQSFQPPPTTYLPAPADGAPALHVGQGAELTDHLKVRPTLVQLFSCSPRYSRSNSSSAHTKCAATMSQILTPLASPILTLLTSTLRSLSSVTTASPNAISTRKSLSVQVSYLILPPKSTKP